MIDIFKSKRRKYEHQLEFVNGRYSILDKGNDWFVYSINNTSEIFEDHYTVIHLYLMGYGLACRSSIVYNPEEKSILIGDIVSTIENKGYGSLVLRSIIKLAKRIEAKEITGNLSCVDSDHFDKLKHFYFKHGFSVVLNSTSTEGKLFFQLND